MILDDQAEPSDILFWKIYEMGEADALDIGTKLGWEPFQIGQVIEELERDGLITHLGDWQVELTLAGRACLEEWGDMSR